MPSPIQGLLINSIQRTITAVPCTDFKTISAALQCERFAVVEIDANNGDCVYVDDEGLLKPLRYFFSIDGRTAHPLAGHGLVLGTNVDGDTVSPAIPPGELRARVTFYDVLGRAKGGALAALAWPASAAGGKSRLTTLPLGDERDI